MNTRVDGNRLAIWLLIAFLITTANFAAFASSSTTSSSSESLFRWSFAIGGAIFVGIWIAVSLAISRRKEGLRALRPSRIGFWMIVGITFLALAGTIAAFYVITVFGANPSREQGLLNQHWEPGRTAPFIGSVIVLVLLTPIAEELFVRGLGFGLFRPFGQNVAITVPALVWALMHGLPAAIFPLFVFGLGLGYLRERSDSVIPGMLVHGLYNGVALALAFA
jgi:membrane protease YdiL (CAAX protease family)